MNRLTFISIAVLGFHNAISPAGGIILSYGYISGEATNEAWPTGGKLIKLPLDKRKIQIMNVTPVFDN